MYYPSLYLVFCMTALFSYSLSNPFTARDDNSRSPHAEFVHTKKATRQLRAAQVETQIGKRSIGQALRCDHELHYVDGKHH